MMMVSLVVASAMVAALSSGGAGFCGEERLSASEQWEQALANANGVYIIALISSNMRGIEIRTWDEAPEAASIDELIDRARASARQVIEYEFRVLDVIYGDQIEFISVDLPHRGSPDNNSHFDHHRDPAFWDDAGVGRGMVAGDCSVVANFRYGDTYILIQSNAWTVRSFERVVSREDRFYEFLVDRFKNN